MRSSWMFLAALGLFVLAFGLANWSFEPANADTCTTEFFAWKAVGSTTCEDDYGPCVYAEEVNGDLVWQSTQGLKWCYDDPPSHGWAEADEVATTSNVTVETPTPSYWQPFVEGDEGETVDPFDVKWSGTIQEASGTGSAGFVAYHWPGRLGGNLDIARKNIAVNQPE